MPTTTIETSAAPQVPGFEHLPIGVLTLSHAMRVQAVSDSFCKLFACERSDVEQRDFEELLSAKDWKGTRQFHSAISRHGGGLLDLHVTLQLSSVEHYVRLRMMRLADGWVVYAENTLEESDLVYRLIVAQERWTSVFRGSEDGIVILSPQHRIIEYNRRFYDLMRFQSSHGIRLSEDALMGKSLPQLLPRRTWAPLVDALAESGTADYSCSISTGEQSLEAKMSRILVPVRGMVGTCLLIRDVSERKQVEELRIRTAEAHFAGMAEVANNMLHNLGNLCGTVLFSSEELLRLLNDSAHGRLAKANAMLAEHTDDRAQFLTVDPKGKLLPDFYTKIGAALEQQHTRVSSLANELFSQVQLMKEAISAQQSYAKGTRLMEPLDLDLVVSDVLQIERLALARHRVIVKRTGGDIGTVCAQRSKLAHILLNLVKNATDAMDDIENEHVLQIHTGRDDENRGFIRVSDNGRGIEADVLRRLFTHGFTTKSTGHGFGLHFCATAMQEMQGTITAASDGRDKGATFLLTFASDPPASDPPSDVASRSEPPVGSAPVASLFPPKTGI